MRIELPWVARSWHRRVVENLERRLAAMRETHGAVCVVNQSKVKNLEQELEDALRTVAKVAAERDKLRDRYCDVERNRDAAIDRANAFEQEAVDLKKALADMTAECVKLGDQCHRAKKVERVAVDNLRSAHEAVGRMLGDIEEAKARWAEQDAGAAAP